MATSVQRSPSGLRHRRNTSMNHLKRSSVGHIARLSALTSAKGDLSDVNNLTIPMITEDADAVTGTFYYVL